MCGYGSAVGGVGDVDQFHAVADVEVGGEEGLQGAAAESVEAVEGEAGEWLTCRAVEHAERALLCGWDVGVRLHRSDFVSEV